MLRNLAKLRKRAGKIRDMDVLTAFTSQLQADGDPLPVIWTEASSRGFSLLDIARWMAEGHGAASSMPSPQGTNCRRIRRRARSIRSVRRVLGKQERLHCRHPVSPYLGEKLRGTVKATYLRGTLIFAQGEFPGVPIGRESRPEA
jgi:allantoinase